MNRTQPYTQYGRGSWFRASGACSNVVVARALNQVRSMRRLGRGRDSACLLDPRSTVPRLCTLYVVWYLLRSLAFDLPIGSCPTGSLKVRTCKGLCVRLPTRCRIWAPILSHHSSGFLHICMLELGSIVYEASTEFPDWYSRWNQSFTSTSTVQHVRSAILLLRGCDCVRTILSPLQEDPALNTNAFSPQLGYVRLQVLPIRPARHPPIHPLKSQQPHCKSSSHFHRSHNGYSFGRNVAVAPG